MKGKRSAKSTGGKIALIILILAISTTCPLA